MISISTDLCYIVLAILVLRLIYRLWKYEIYPRIIDKGVTVIEKNPKWITAKLRKEYYGFDDIDFTIAKSVMGPLPRFRLSKDKVPKLELLISEDTPTREVEKLAQIALVGKIKIKYGLFFPDKPIYWLSILCYMLDGGNIREEATSWTDKTEKGQETN